MKKADTLDNEKKTATRRAGVFGPAILFLLAPIILAGQNPAPISLGQFEAQTDVGEILNPGSATYDAQSGKYVVTGSGANMWASTDEFHFVWKRMSGDITFKTNLTLEGAGGNEHRKAGLMIRQGLESGSPYVDAVVHGIGLTALQYRQVMGGPTLEVTSPISSPSTLELVRHGNTFTLSVAKAGAPLQPVGSVTLQLTDPVYVGLAVCAHEGGGLLTADFDHVSLTATPSAAPQEPEVESSLEIIAPDGTDRQVIYHAQQRFEAPNWSRGGKYLIFNSIGHIFKINVDGGEPRLMDTGTATHANNDHSLSPDGLQLAISNSPQDQSLIYVVPISGGEPRLITPQGPSYLHSWSPDGKTLAYCAERNGNFDVYTIPVQGGAETRLTDAPGLDDGPDYSPDGHYIYFNSERTGLMQIWRMNADGSGQQQFIHDDYADWFPHPSPDGKWLVFLSYDKSVQGHPADKDVMLRIVSLTDPAETDKPRILVKLFGGQGTINVPSWAPDSKHFAFVSYRLIHP